MAVESPHGSFPATAARFDWCVTSSVGCTAPKALATHTAKFLSPPCGFVAPFGRHGRGRAAASCAHDVRLQMVTIVSRFARMTRLPAVDGM